MVLHDVPQDLLNSGRLGCFKFPQRPNLQNPHPRNSMTFVRLNIALLAITLLGLMSGSGILFSGRTALSMLT
jgi:hypothetical protein